MSIRLVQRNPPLPPKNTCRATFFRVTGASDRPLTCAAYDVETGLELRLAYSEDDAASYFADRIETSG